MEKHSLVGVVAEVHYASAPCSISDFFDAIESFSVKAACQAVSQVINKDWRSLTLCFVCSTSLDLRTILIDNF